MRHRGRVGLSGRVSVVLRHVGLVVVPGLCALHENIRIGFEPARIVQGADAKSNEVWAGPNLHVKRCAAITAEGADDVVAAIGFRDIALWRALEDAEPRGGDASGRNVGRAALPLAVPAMTPQSEGGFAHRLIANCAAEAAACSGVGHI